MGGAREQGTGSQDRGAMWAWRRASTHHKRAAQDVLLRGHCVHCHHHYPARALAPGPPQGTGHRDWERQWQGHVRQSLNTGAPCTMCLGKLPLSFLAYLEEQRDRDDTRCPGRAGSSLWKPQWETPGGWELWSGQADGGSRVQPPAGPLSIQIVTRGRAIPQWPGQLGGWGWVYRLTSPPSTT